jgi:hypothetical protein
MEIVESLDWHVDALDATAVRVAQNVCRRQSCCGPGRTRPPSWSRRRAGPKAPRLPRGRGADRIEHRCQVASLGRPGFERDHRSRRREHRDREFPDVGPEIQRDTVRIAQRRNQLHIRARFAEAFQDVVFPPPVQAWRESRCGRSELTFRRPCDRHLRWSPVLGRGYAFTRLKRGRAGSAHVTLRYTHSCPGPKPPQCMGALQCASMCIGSSDNLDDDDPLIGPPTRPSPAGTCAPYRRSPCRAAWISSSPQSPPS